MEFSQWDGYELGEWGRQLGGAVDFVRALIQRKIYILEEHAADGRCLRAGLWEPDEEVDAAYADTVLLRTLYFDREPLERRLE